MKIVYESFAPVKIRFEDVPAGKIVGEVSVCITDVRVLVKDLSMGMEELKGVGIYGTSELFQVLTMTIEAPGMTLYKMQKMAHGLADKIYEIDKIVRAYAGKELLD